MIQQSNATNTTTHIVHGWVSSPNGRGTLDILRACLATVFLCTYTVLFLNIKEHTTRTKAVLYKTKWVVFTIFFPEVTTAMAAEQWRSARQSVEDFARLRKRLEETVENAGRAVSVGVLTPCIPEAYQSMPPHAAKCVPPLDEYADPYRCVHRQLPLTRVRYGCTRCDGPLDMPSLQIWAA